MIVDFIEYKESNFPFLQKMLYEAVFWRKSDNVPSFEDGLEYPGVKNALKEWSKREGDLAVLATVDLVPVGAAWIRYWTKDNNIRGYYDDRVPVLVIGVHETYRRMGVGSKLIFKLCDKAVNKNIQKISLCVSKDNHALRLYRKTGFKVISETDDSFIMEKKLFQ